MARFPATFRFLWRECSLDGRQHSGNLFENAGATGSGNPMDEYDKKLTSVRAVAAQTD
jgi:hypothetical protein